MYHVKRILLVEMQTTSLLASGVLWLREISFQKSILRYSQKSILRYSQL